MNTKLLTAYNAWIEADMRWQAELERVYGSRAGDARYTSEGTATPALNHLKSVFRQRGEEYHKIESSVNTCENPV